MACPLCGEHCRCSVTASATRAVARTRASSSPSDRVMIDPEAYDPTEEQFTVSVSRSMNPQETEPTHHPRARAGNNGIERELGEHETLEANLSEKAKFWRDEVANRVEGYRERRSKKRLSGEFSMKLDFEPRPMRGAAAYALAEPEPEPPMPSNSHEPAADHFVTPAQNYAAAPTPEPYAGQSSLIVEVPADEAAWNPLPPLPGETAAPAKKPAAPVRESPVRESKIIEFPRALVFPEFEQALWHDPNELAEPMLDKPRILDVPEMVSVTAPPLSDVALYGEPEEEPLPPRAFELPLQVAPLPQRFTAAVMDSALVLTGMAMFAAIVLRGATGLPHTKPVLGLALAIPVVFWAVYHYIFLVYGATTPGMQMAHIRMSTFEGGRAPLRVRQYRALVMVLSCVSLGFGFLWSLFDEDNLCWHDRMTHTYLTTER